MTVLRQALALSHGTFASIRRDPTGAGVGSLMSIATGMMVDVAKGAMIAVATLTGSVVLFAMQYVLTRRAMRSGDLLSQDAPGAIALFFGLTFVSGLAITLGFVFLILPGIWLYARWLSATPVLFTHDGGVFEAMDVSARRNRPMLPAITAMVGVFHLPLLVALAVTLSADVDAPPGIMASLAINAAIAVSQILACYLAVAVYSATLPEPLASIFD